MGFQTSIATQPAAALAGDWASKNPRHSYVAGPGGLVAGAGGLTVGRFAWVSQSPYSDPNYAPKVAANAGWGDPVGILHREQQGLITTYLAESGLILPAGFQCWLVSAGDLWVINSNASVPAQIGHKVYAEYASGKCLFAATGSAPTATNTSFTIAAATQASVTASITDNVMTVTAVGAGVLRPGATISGSGVVTGTKITAQLSGTAGGAGTYAVNIAGQSVASTTITQDYGTLTLSGTNSGAFAVGMTLTGTGITAGSHIIVETKWRAVSGGNAGELVKISSEPL